MRTQQRFEGPDLEALLDEVRSTYGEDVAILEANKIRSGGVGGFFARELFEIVIDLDDDEVSGAERSAPVRSATGSVESAAASILDLVDRVDDGPAPRADERDLAQRDTIDRLMAKTADAPVIEPAPTTLSTDGDAFAELLGRIAQSSQDAPVSPAPRLDDLQGRAGAPDPDEPFQPFATTAPTAERPAPATPATPAASTPQAAPRGMRMARPQATTVETRRPMVEQLGLDRLGVPELYLHDALPGRDRMSALLELADRFPLAGALPRLAASVIVLVGDRRGIQPAVEFVCSELQLDPAALLLASQSESRVFPEERRIASGDEACARRLSFRRRPTPSLVVVDQPVGRIRSSWARQVVDALEPTAVWGVVEAKAKAEDIVDWCEQLGGVDALALHAVDDTTTPASVLHTGLPVSLLDGRAATASRWAAVLDERLLAA